MAGQAHVNGQVADRRAGAALRRNMAGLMHDVISLAELQIQLLAIDLRDTGRHSLVPLGMLVGGAILALGAIPVLLLGCGRFLVSGAGWSEGAAFLFTALVALAVAGVAGWLGWKTLQQALGMLARSKTELADNVRWMKNALEQSSSPEITRRQPADWPRPID